mgnify:CR=1 FL=1
MMALSTIGGEIWTLLFAIYFENVSLIILKIS